MGRISGVIRSDLQYRSLQETLNELKKSVQNTPTEESKANNAASTDSNVDSAKQTTVDPATNTSGTLSFSASSSLQFMYAKLQLTQSNQMKTQAEELMKQIEEKQQLQQEVANMISAARDAQSKAGDKDSTAMSDELKAFFTAHNLSYQETNGKCSKDQWEYNIKSLTNYQDTLGTDTQTKMVYLQDYISQYNSYLQGASQQISDSGSTMQTILRNS